MNNRIICFGPVLVMFDSKFGCEWPIYHRCWLKDGFKAVNIYIYIVNAQTFSDLVGTAGKLHHDMGIAAWFQMNEDTYTN